MAGEEAVEPLQVQGEVQKGVPGPEEEEVVPPGVDAVEEGVAGLLALGLEVVPPKPLPVAPGLLQEGEDLRGEEDLQGAGEGGEAARGGEVPPLAAEACGEGLPHAVGVQHEGPEVGAPSERAASSAKVRTFSGWGSSSSKSPSSSAQAR